MAGHGPASNLPPTLCSNCQGDNRRVITVRIFSGNYNVTWDYDTNGNHTPGQTNAHIWNAVQCAINQWNTMRAPDGYTTGYYLVLDQAGQVPGTADITIQRRQVTSADGTPGFASTTDNGWPYTTSLSPSNGTLGGGSFTTDDLCGRLAHEIGHPLGLSNESGCNSIMTGVNPDGTRDVNQVTAEDVYQVNRNLDNTTRTNGHCTGYAGDSSGEEHVCDDTMANNCYANGGTWDYTTCMCSGPTVCDQTQASYCWNNGGNWNSDICTCDYPQYYYGGGGGYYCQYECYDYYTAVSTDGENWEYEYKGRECYQTGCYYYY